MLQAKIFVVPNPSLMIVNEHQEFVILVEVWLHNAECNNWGCHEGPVPVNSLELKQIAGLKEGKKAIITIQHPDTKQNIDVEVTPSQRDSRYREYGDFEEALNAVIEYGPNFPVSYSRFRPQMVEIFNTLVKEASK